MTDTTPTPEAVADLARRLRGEYRIPITDGLGPAGGEEPDNAHEFVRHFPSPPIQNDAAAMLETLAAVLAAQTARADAAAKQVRMNSFAGESYAYMQLRADAAEAKVARLVEALTPSDKTKAAYIGEFGIPFETVDTDGNEVTMHKQVPWATIKEIMAAIRSRAAIAEVQG